MHKLNSCAEIYLTKTVIPFSVSHLELLSIEWHNYKYHTLKMTQYPGSKCQTQLLSKVCFYSFWLVAFAPHIRLLSFLCGRERRGTRQRRGRHSPFLWAGVCISSRVCIWVVLLMLLSQYGPLYVLHMIWNLLLYVCVVGWSIHIPEKSHVPLLMWRRRQRMSFHIFQCYNNIFELRMGL
jgi:hypothetical protein